MERHDAHLTCVSCASLVRIPPTIILLQSSRVSAQSPRWYTGRRFPNSSLTERTSDRSLGAVSCYHWVSCLATCDRYQPHDLCSRILHHSVTPVLLIIRPRGQTPKVTSKVLSGELEVAKQEIQGTPNTGRQVGPAHWSLFSVAHIHCRSL